jgi:hypothetical protein
MRGVPGSEPLVAATSASPAEWIAAGVRDFAHDVGSVVPATFEAHARVCHPASRDKGDDTAEVRWTEVARANGRVMHPAAEWGSITGSWEHLSQAPLWDHPPLTGELPSAVATRMAAVLAEHTGTPERCWFAVWEGFAGFAPEWESAPRFEVPGRRMLLLTGPITAAGVSLAAEPWISRSANLWWPDDHAWCVGTDIDLMTTYVGASASCVQALQADPTLEVVPVSADQRIIWDSDTINPLPPAPH